MAKFRMKSAPGKPVRRKIWDSITLCDGMSLEDIYKLDAPKEAEINIEKDYDSYDGYCECSVSLEWQKEEPEEEFQKRMEQYGVKLFEYNQWLENNEETVNLIEAKHKEQEKTKQQKKKDKYILGLIKERDRIEKALKDKGIIK